MGTSKGTSKGTSRSTFPGAPTPPPPTDDSGADDRRHCTVFTRDSAGTVSSEEIEESTVADSDALERMYHHLGADQFCWISVSTPSTLTMLGLSDVFGIHELIVEDAVTGGQRPKVEHYDDQLLLVARTIENGPTVSTGTDAGTNERTRTGEVLIVVGDRFVLTIGHGTTGRTRDLTARVNSALDRSFSPHSVLFAVTDAVVDRYASITDALEDDVDAMEDAVFSRSGDFSIGDIYLQMREVLTIRHAVDPFTPALTTLSRRDGPDLPYVRDVLDHQIQAAGRIDNYAQRLSALIDTASARISLQQNTDMRKISAWAGVIAVPTLFTGFYGMNFVHMPELDTTWGYPAVIVAIVASVVALVIIFRRNNWL
ncbi:MAG TPA: magnesium and cobalt transport protein CorA [Candidatus Corynebacterium avicola]|uniref:Magnesium and cobalt transport protein CorA n=1 Tax=Candidatus Corynebacterium avicola TaxID=2838527 RepID=A0A9D1UJJ1_9CORY|nr:magnesium and cobalt transport protein CorA [Candidatus Corynebacterium avicola]